MAVFVRSELAERINAGCMALMFICMPAASWSASADDLSPSSPILIPATKDTQVRLTSAVDGVYFDIDGDGVPEQIAWTKADTDVAFLAVDRNGDGRITSGRELFGNFTYPGVSSGFVALQRMAMETNGGVKRASVSSDDPLFGRLLLWTDGNHNGISEPWELVPARRTLSDIGLGYEVRDRQDRFGNLFRFRGWASIRTKPGRNEVMSPKEDEQRRLVIWAYLLDKA